MPGIPAPPTPADPNQISKNLSPDYKEKLDPSEFVSQRIKSLIDVGEKNILKEINKINIEAKKPLSIKSGPIDPSKSIDDFLKSFKKNYSSDYNILKRFIEVTDENNNKFEILKKDIQNIINLSKKHLDSDSQFVNPSNVEEAPM